MIIRKTIDLNKNLSEEQIKMLEALEDREITFDEDCPELTKEELSKFKIAKPREQTA